AITPKTKIPTNKIQKLISLMNLSRIAPIMNATTGYNSKNPAEEPEHDGSAEWNAYWDPEAVKIVFDSDIEIDMVALESTNQVP
ncbi:nucleoside hydrolase, partial [Staphylococcus sp. EG-SA-17]|uniref:nucleoside hydrolase n=1 Tax=Staphylococcus sp. EG-SA-17 TaxID=2767493 RepID=UPI00320AEE5F